MRWAFGPYELDLSRRELRVDGAIRQLQPQVFDVLAYLVDHRDRVVPKDELLRELWPDAVVADGSLQRAVSVARRALRAPDRTLLRTYPRLGYRFVGEATPLGQDPAGELLASPPRYARVGDVHVAYRAVGSGPVDVVLALGWSATMSSALALRGGAELVRALAARARVILFDKRGTGASDRVKALSSLDERIRDLDGILEAARSPGAVLVGFSEGGPMAIAFAARRPARARGLALVGSFARMAAAPDHPHGWSAEELAATRAYLSGRWGVGATMLAIVPERHRSAAVRAWAARAEQEGASPGAALELLDMNLAIDVRPLLPALRTPTVVLHAAADRVVRVGNGRALAEAIPSARYVELPGDDHAFLFGGRPTLVRELEALLQRAVLRAPAT